MNTVKNAESTRTEREFNSQFARDVFLGLSENPKWLSSKYFYDETGDKIFQEIMHMDSYYLSRAELNIFENQSDKILDDISKDGCFRLIELGAGDGLKTKVLLEHMVNAGADFTYAPCDISGHVLQLLHDRVSPELPSLAIELLEGDYFKVLEESKLKSDSKNVVLFLGSNLGNYTKEKAINFLKQVRTNLKKGDQFLLGLDLKKDPEDILLAYDDPDGITERFNKNLLTRINRELGGEFDVECFQHHAMYDPVSGECRSYLMSQISKDILIKELDTKFSFHQWEPIFMELSKKFDLIEITEWGKIAGFKLVNHYQDSDKKFMDVLFDAV